MARVIRYCQDNHPAECVDIVLISVEHVALIRITPGEKVQHTAIMPLFNITNHFTVAVNDRYTNRCLENLVAKDEKETDRAERVYWNRMLRYEGLNASFLDDDDDDDKNWPGKKNLCCA